MGGVVVLKNGTAGGHAEQGYNNNGVLLIESIRQSADRCHIRGHSECERVSAASPMASLHKKPVVFVHRLLLSDWSRTVSGGGESTFNLGEAIRDALFSVNAVDNRHS